jgi:hypothetical protein
MKDGDRCPECVGGTMRHAIFRVVKGVSMDVLECDWCGYKTGDDSVPAQPRWRDLPKAQSRL